MERRPDPESVMRVAVEPVTRVLLGARGVCPCGALIETWDKQIHYAVATGGKLQSIKCPRCKRMLEPVARTEPPKDIDLVRGAMLGLGGRS